MTIEVYPTLSCNLDCSFCDTTDRHRPPVNELTPQRWLEIVEEAAAMGVKRIFILGGGEPLLRRDVTPMLMRRAKELGMEGVLTTNGTLFDAALNRQLVETGWDEVHFSIDGPTPEIHDGLRGMSGAFRRTVRNACSLRVARTAAGATRPRIALHFVLTNKNWQTLPEMVHLAHALGAFRIDFDALIAYKPEQLALKLNPEQTRAVRTVAQTALEEAKRLGIQTTLENFLDPARIDRGNTTVPMPTEPGLAGAPCLKAWHYLVVDADGNSSPCCVLTGNGGSARDTALETLWRKDPFLERVRTGMLKKEPLSRCRECTWNILSHEAEIRRHLEEPGTRDNRRVD